MNRAPHGQPLMLGAGLSRLSARESLVAFRADPVMCLQPGLSELSVVEAIFSINCNNSLNQ